MRSKKPDSLKSLKILHQDTVKNFPEINCQEEFEYKDGSFIWNSIPGSKKKKGGGVDRVHPKKSQVMGNVILQLLLSTLFMMSLENYIKASCSHISWTWEKKRRDGNQGLANVLGLLCICLEIGWRQWILKQRNICKTYKGEVNTATWQNEEMKERT